MLLMVLILLPKAQTSGDTAISMAIDADQDAPWSKLIHLLKAITR